MHNLLIFKCFANFSHVFEKDLIQHEMSLTHLEKVDVGTVNFEIDEFFY